MKRRLSGKVVALIDVHEPPEPKLERVGRIIGIRAVRDQPTLNTFDVVWRSRSDPVWRSRLCYKAPQFLAAASVLKIELVPTLLRPAGTRNDHLNAVNLMRTEGKIA